ncbi:MAG TPA: tetratricopeptide repeat protein [Gallionella sp.]|nr:tetratricopeptide repeat protein [Gallionella sp.]
MNAISSRFLYDKSRVGIMLTSVCFGLMSAACGAYAQETGQRSGRHGIEPITQKPAGIADYGKQLDEADTLIKNGNPADAYILLEPLEFNHSGEPRFDYLIGIAALDSGKPDKATLAFERALAVNPDFAAARLDMARAYYQLGDMPRARTEFATVLKQHPSEAARLTIQKYLDAIAVQEGSKLTHVTGYVEGMVGYDSNVNYSTSQSQIYVDYFASSYPLDSTSIQASDNYYGLALGGAITRSLDTNWSLYAAADLWQRNNRIQKGFDTLGLDAQTGVMLGTKNERLRVGAFGGRYNLGVSHYSDINGLNADWSHVFSPSNQFKAFGQYAQYRYLEAVMQVNDYNQQVLGAGWLHVKPDGKSTLFGSLYHGTETDISNIITLATPEGGRADGAKRFNGLRIGGQTLFAGKSTMFINSGAQIGHYDKVNPLFLRQRDDRFYDLIAGLNMHLGGRWVLRPQVIYSRNISNIPIYSYDRTDVSLTVRRDFR